jgi:hypothetical protein
VSADQHQHYLPQSYQRGWADAHGFVHVYEWRYNKVVCAAKATKSTGARNGLYFMPMAPPERRNIMEDGFWKQIDQWGADELASLRSSNDARRAEVDRERLAIFVMSFLFRNPRKIAEFEAQAKAHSTSDSIKANYAKYRRQHEPETFEEFVRQLEQPGLTELGAQVLRHAVLNQAIRAHLLTMEWRVVRVSGGVSLLTSDVPIITFKGAKDPDGLIILPLSPSEFFVAFNNGPIDMQASIDENIRTGVFIEAMNKFVVRNKIEFVYGADDTAKHFVEQYWRPVNKAG